jgi:selenocysteine-specific elongation factor
MRVIGTAGHVDHGKSTLIAALTGIDPDRLREEKERGMTIDLGFAWLRLPNGQEVSIVDVPGHERFIHNMLAGVGGIDIALLVVAADEGIMPQTREHLAILDLLGIDSGVVAVTKRDLVDDEWLELVTSEIEETLAETSLKDAPMVPVSAVTRQGLPELVAALEHLLEKERTRRLTGKPRLPIDRVFTMAGFGTVVTGTLVDGELSVGQEVEVQPGGRKVRVRGLQSHKKKVNSVPAGTRVAVNLTGVDRDELQRGQVLAAPRWLTPTNLIDVKLRLVRDLPRPVGHNTLITFHTGTAEASGRLRLLDRASLEPGQTAWAQVRLSDQVAVAKGDLFIIRQPTPSLTLGGGTVVDPHPKRHRRFQERVLEQLSVLERGTPDEVLMQHLQAREPSDVDGLIKRAGIAPEEARRVLAGLVERGALVALDGRSGALTPQTLIITESGWEGVVQRLLRALTDYHAQFPLRRGMPREEVRARVGADPRFFGRLVEALTHQGAIAEEGPLLRLSEHQVRLSGDDAAAADMLVRVLREAGVAPPSPRELEVDLGLSSELIRALIERGDLVEVSPEIVYERDTYQSLVDRVVEEIRANGGITVARVRDLFSTSRKYALPLLEHLDERHVTRRVGDERVLY